MSNVVAFPIIPRMVPIPASRPRTWSPPHTSKLLAMVTEAVKSPALARALMTRQYRERHRHCVLDMISELGADDAIAMLEDCLSFAKQGVKS